MYVQTCAARNEISGIHGDCIKLRLKAQPLEGKANACLCKYLAKLCGVSKSQVQIIKGHHSRHKRVSIQGLRALPDALAQLKGTPECA